MKLEIVKMSAANKASVGDQFIIEDKLYTVIKLTKKFVVTNHGIMFPLVTFNKWVRMEKSAIKRAAEVSVRELNVRLKEAAILLKEQWIKEEQEKSAQAAALKLPLFYETPVMSLRFIIVVIYTNDYENKEYRWVFATGHTSHSSLEQGFEKSLRDAGISFYDVQAVSGGFYNYVTANAKSNGQLNTLFLFGKSDSYGLSKQHYEAALPVLKASPMLKGVVIDDSAVLTHFINEQEMELAYQREQAASDSLPFSSDEFDDFLEQEKYHQMMEEADDWERRMMAAEGSEMEL